MSEYLSRQAEKGFVEITKQALASYIAICAFLAGLGIWIKPGQNITVVLTVALVFLLLAASIRVERDHVRPAGQQGRDLCEQTDCRERAHEAADYCSLECEIMEKGIEASHEPF